MKRGAVDGVEVQRLQAALERWTRRDKKCRDLSRRVREAQRELRALVGDDGWKLYLALEERMNARHCEVILAALHLALARKKPRRSSLK
ncbi:MAG TPA: hypothetical protein VGH28_16850 [Polyangiaceae bacterium]